MYSITRNYLLNFFHSTRPSSEVRMRSWSSGSVMPASLRQRKEVCKSSRQTGDLSVVLSQGKAGKRCSCHSVVEDPPTYHALGLQKQRSHWREQSCEKQTSPSSNLLLRQRWWLQLAHTWVCVKVETTGECKQDSILSVGRGVPAFLGLFQATWEMLMQGNSTPTVGRSCKLCCFLHF